MKTIARFRALACAAAFFCLTGGTAAQEAGEKYVFDDTLRALNMLVRGDSLMSYREHHPEALALFKKANRIYSELEVSSPNSAMSVEAIGYGYFFLEKYDSATIFFERSIDAFKGVYGEVHKEVATRYNNLAVASTQIGNYPKAAGAHQKAIAIKEKLADPCGTQLSISYRQLGQCHLHQEQYAAAVENLEKAIQIKLGCAPADDPAFADDYNDLGCAVGHLGDHARSLELLEKARKLYEKAGGAETSTSYLNCLNNLALEYKGLGHYEKALPLFFRTLELKTKKFGEAHSVVGHAFQSLGNFYVESGSPALAIEYCNRALAVLSKSLGEKHPILSSVHNDLGTAYSYMGDLDQSEKHHRLALDLRVELAGPQSLSVARSYHNMACNFADRGRDSTAIGYFQKAIEIFLKTQDGPMPELAKIYAGQGIIYTKMGMLDSAMAVFERAAEVYLKGSATEVLGMAALLARKGMALQKARDFEKAKAAFDASIPILEKIGAAPDLKWVLERASNFYRDWHLATQNPAHLEASQGLAFRAVAIFDTLSQKLSPGDRTKQADWSSGLFGTIVANDFLLKKHAEAFSFAERAKAHLLFGALRESRALRFSNIPDSLLKQEYGLRIDIAYQDKKRQDLRAAGATDLDSALLTTGGRLFDLNRRYDALKARFEKDYEKYYRAKYDLATVPLAELQRGLLQPGQSMVEYLIGDSAVYVFVVRRDTFFVHEIKRDFPLDEWVRDLTKDGIHGYHALPIGSPLRTAERQKACDNNYTRTAQLLYQMLWQPIAGEVTERVIVVPDGVLGYVPFEALLTRQPARPGAFGSYPGCYLIDKYQISYCYSATLLREMSGNRDRPAANLSSDGTGELLAMAPFFRGDTARLWEKLDTADLHLSAALRDSFGPLAGSGPEVAAIAKTWGGTTFYGKDATLENFRAAATGHRIVHLSTHGQADDRQGDYAFLGFSSPDGGSFEKLYARDLYNLPLAADLVMLSACETGTGKLNKGEGIVSLARAFAYAGAASIFTTLWKVQDGSTGEVSVPFYQSLKKGKTKDKALRLAKLAYLKKHKGAAAHPFYWAGLIGIGDMGPVR